MAKTDVTVTEEKAAVVCNQDMPAFQVETSAEDMILPFLKIVQSLSEEVTQGKEKYNENVKAGDIYDSVTRTIYNDAEIIVCGIRKYYGEWEGDVRGKLIAKHRIDSDVVKNATKIEKVSPKGTPYFDLKTKNDHTLEETFGVVCLIKQHGVYLPATFTLSKSSFSIGKTLNTMLTMFQTNGVPRFKFKTNLKSNDKGSWFVPVFEMAGYEEDAHIINMASNLHNATDNIIFSFSAGELDTPTEEAENEEVV